MIQAVDGLMLGDSYEAGENETNPGTKQQQCLIHRLPNLDYDLTPLDSYIR